MDKKYPCIESTLDIEIGEKVYRLWINEVVIRDSYPENHFVVDRIREFIEKTPSYKNEEIFDYVNKLSPHINAMQVITKGKESMNGIVVYFVDFSDKDPHG